MSDKHTAALDLDALQKIVDATGENYEWRERWEPQRENFEKAMTPHVVRELIALARRASEGQAQTSAATDAQFGTLENWLEDYNSGRITQKDFINYLNRRAAQLADSTAPGAPVEETYSCWSCKKPYTLSQRSYADGRCPHCDVDIDLDVDMELDDELAAPTAQQSLTAGGAVPDAWRELAERCLSSMKSAVHFRKTGQGRPPEQTCLFEIQDLEKALAAAPLPQVQSEALEREKALSGALTKVMSWIDNWSPEFTDDDEWPTDRDAARAALAQQAIKPSVDNDGGVA